MKNLFYLLSLILFVCTSCDKSMDIEGPDFDVTVEPGNFKAGDTLSFKFKGNADVVTFNSGEKGELFMSFASQTRFGSQPNQLSIQVSTDFNGNYTEAAIKAANWVDVSSRFIFSTNTTLLSSGVKNIGDLSVPGKPLYFAFKYVGQASATGTQRNWWVNNLKVDNILAGVSANVIGQATADWKFVNFAANSSDAGWAAVADGRILFDPKGSLLYSEGWALTKAIFPDEFKALPLPVKAFIDDPLSSYNYVFTTPGTYLVTFEAANVNRFDNKKVTKQLEITINPK